MLDQKFVFSNSYSYICKMYMYKVFKNSVTDRHTDIKKNRFI